MGKKIKRKGPSGSAVQKLATRDMRRVAKAARKNDLLPNEMEDLGDLVATARTAEMQNDIVAARLIEASASGLSKRDDASMKTARDVVSVGLSEFRERGVVTPNLAEVAEMVVSNPYAKAEVRRVAEEILHQRSEQLRDGIVETDREIAEPRVDLIRKNDGKRIADDEVVSLRDGDEFVTVPRVNLSEDEKARTPMVGVGLGSEMIRGTGSIMRADEDGRQSALAETSEGEKAWIGAKQTPNAITFPAGAEAVQIPVPEEWAGEPSPAIKLAQAMGALPGGTQADYDVAQRAAREKLAAMSPEERERVRGAVETAQKASGIHGGVADLLDPYEAAVEWVSFLIPMVQRLARQQGQMRKQGEAVNNARVVWPHLNNARVFAIPQRTYAAVSLWADRHTTTDVVGWEWEGPREDDNATADEAETEHYVAALREACKTQPYPERLPFDDTLLVYGSGIGMSEAQLEVHLGNKGDDDENYYADTVEDATLVAHLLTAHGDVWEFIVGSESDRGAFVFHQIRSGEHGWEAGVSLMPWVVPAIVDVLNSFKSVVHEKPQAMSFGQRKKWERERRERERKFGVPGRKLPPPFYRVELHHELVEEKLKERSGTKLRMWKLNHRCDVRGHERARIARGPLPLDPEMEQKYLRRGYSVFTSMTPPASDPAWRVLAERHERPKAPHEWIAIKVSWVRPHVRGPEDAPYIPAVRTLPKGTETP